MPEQVGKLAQAIKLNTLNKHFTEADLSSSSVFSWDMKDLGSKGSFELSERDPLGLKHPTTTIHMPTILGTRNRAKLASEAIDLLPNEPSPVPDSIMTPTRDRNRICTSPIASDPSSVVIKLPNKPELQPSRFKNKVEERKVETSNSPNQLTKVKSLDDRSRNSVLDKSSKESEKLQEYLFMSQMPPASQNTSMTHPNNQVKDFVSKKLAWHVDTSTLVRKQEFKTIMSMLVSKYHLQTSDYTTVRHHLLQLTSYFEAFVQKLFVDSKSNFFETEFIKAVFSEELNLRRGRESRSINDSRRNDEHILSSSVRMSLRLGRKEALIEKEIKYFEVELRSIPTS
jgi:hypothetical protein